MDYFDNSDPMTEFDEHEDHRAINEEEERMFEEREKIELTTEEENHIINDIKNEMGPRPYIKSKDLFLEQQIAQAEQDEKELGEITIDDVRAK